MIHRTLPLLLLICCRAALATPAVDRFGVSAGAGLPLLPLGELAGSASLSAVMTRIEPGTGPAGLMQLRGEVLGLWSPQGDACAALPLLLGDLGLELGPARLYLSGGLELFGVAWRKQHTFFTILGLAGGAGVTVQVHPRVALELRGLVCWMPLRTSAVMQEPEETDADRPRLLFSSLLLGAVFPL